MVLNKEELMISQWFK